MEPDIDGWLEAAYEDRHQAEWGDLLDEPDDVYDADIDPDDTDIDNWTGEPTL